MCLLSCLGCLAAGWHPPNMGIEVGQSSIHGRSYIAMLDCERVQHQSHACCIKCFGRTTLTNVFFYLAPKVPQEEAHWKVPSDRGSLEKSSPHVTGPSSSSLEPGLFQTPFSSISSLFVVIPLSRYTFLLQHMILICFYQYP